MVPRAPHAEEKWYVGNYGWRNRYSRELYQPRVEVWQDTYGWSWKARSAGRRASINKIPFYVMGCVSLGAAEDDQAVRPFVQVSLGELEESMVECRYWARRREGAWWDLPGVWTFLRNARPESRSLRSLDRARGPLTWEQVLGSQFGRPLARRKHRDVAKKQSAMLAYHEGKFKGENGGYNWQKTMAWKT